MKFKTKSELIEFYAKERLQDGLSHTAKDIADYIRERSNKTEQYLPYGTIQPVLYLLHKKEPAKYL